MLHVHVDQMEGRKSHEYEVEALILTMTKSHLNKYPVPLLSVYF